MINDTNRSCFLSVKEIIIHTIGVPNWINHSGKCCGIRYAKLLGVADWWCPEWWNDNGWRSWKYRWNDLQRPKDPPCKGSWVFWRPSERTLQIRHFRSADLWNFLACEDTPQSARALFHPEGRGTRYGFHCAPSGRYRTILLESKIHFGLSTAGPCCCQRWFRYAPGRIPKRLLWCVAWLPCEAVVAPLLPKGDTRLG